LEQTIIDSRVETASGAVAALEPEMQRKWINTLVNAVKSVQNQGFMPILLTSEAARQLVKTSAKREIPDIVVLSFPELTSDVKVEALGEIRLEE
jgi:flagellar biosynthesis protein FlhA